MKRELCVPLAAQHLALWHRKVLLGEYRSSSEEVEEFVELLPEGEWLGDQALLELDEGNNLVGLRVEAHVPDLNTTVKDFTFVYLEKGVLELDADVVVNRLIDEIKLYESVL